ncbi:ExeM/NucH family extracellular endonuclease [Xanthobacter sp. KR7-225]|uniref:ExeM/NucH family extracellular endonuclease n=1 Tax=Xanthobacter sp. KR7-225 TaxID=3156613 RepID=UPI0032B5E7DE
MATTPHVLSTGDFSQNWSNAGLITADDNWSNVSAIVGYLGDIDGGSTTNVDPQTLTGAALGTVDVIANQAATTITNGGVAEFDSLANPTVALQGSGTADAPSLVIYLDATDRTDVTLTFDARDIDGSADNAAQQIAVQYRLGNSGAWTNVTGGYAADVTTASAATQSTAFDLTLPEAVNGRADLQVRILTTNAAGSDEWVGIDNIKVTSAPAVETQKVGFALDSLALSLVEGDTGTKLFTFTVERTGGTTGDVSFSGSFLEGDTAADDFANLISGFAGIIADGFASTTVTLEVNGDTVIEANEAFSLTLTDVSNSAGIATSLLAERASAAAAILNDDAAPASEIGGIEILDMAESLAGSVETPVATETLSVTRRGSWVSGDGEGGSESITFDDTTARAYVTNAASDRIDVLDLSDPFAPVKVDEIDLSTLPGYGEVNSVAARDGVIAVAVQNADGGENGLVALFDGTGALIKTITVGALPDQLTFSPDGTLLLVANEGEPYNDETAGVIENAPGSVSVIDMAAGAANATVRNTIGFSALDGFEAQLSDLGIKIFAGSGDLPAPTASQDIEPEYVAVSPDGTKAYVTLQEVNAVAVIDLTDAAADKPVSILPAGYVDFSLAGNEADFSDRDGASNGKSISVGNAPVNGLLQPDAIASFEIDGTTYFITANEGDTRIVQNGSEGLNEARASSFGVTDADYARYNLDTVWTTSADDLYGFGGRGVSIFKQNLDGTVEKVEETGGDFEQILAALPNASTVFNGENGGSFDTRSDNKGAEPEGVTVGEVNGKMYAFVALERIGGVMVWDVSTPEDAKYVTYVAPTSDDYGPEVIKFVSAEDSPTGRALLMTANEISGSVTVYDLEDPNVTKISAVQGEGASSGMVGQTVTVEAIVVGDFQNGDADASRNLGGFYIQEEAFDEDGNPLTSEGIFVYGGTGDVNVGDRVRVTATVSEYFGMTELNATAIEVIEAGAVENIDAMAQTISLPADGVTTSQDGDAQPDLEAYEGMLVTVEQELTITEQFNLDRFNEIKLVAGERPAQFTQENAPDAAAYAAYLESLGARTITYDDGLNVQNAAISNLDGFDPYTTETAPRMGDTITGLTGVLDYQWAGNSASGSTWRIRSVEDGANTFEEGTPREAAPEDVGGRLTVASLNVLNYFTTIDTISDSSSDQPGDNTAAGFDPRGADSEAEFARQTEKLVGTILAIDPDVLALVELENDFLAGSDGNALEYLVDQLNAELGAEIYAWVDPGTQFVGGDAIAVGFIYKPSEVTVAYDTTIEILDDADLATLGLDGLLDQSTVDGIFTGVNTSRAALAVTFEEVETGETFTAIANHLKSKSGAGTDADADQLDGQGAWQQQRELAATALTAWAESDPTGSDDGDVLLLGDFNAYAKEDAVGILEDAGFESLETRLEDPYSYVFDGQTGSLDYIFANQTLAAQVTGVTHWHINSDEADALDYNTDYGRDPSIFDADSPVRTSDHDPLIIGLNLEEEPEVADYTLQLLHFSDGEAGLLASETAPNLAALVDAYDDDYANTLILAGGDNWIPGPFLAAGTDPAVRDAINEVTGSTMTGTIPIAAADIAIHNVIGVEASALGNHDFDLGSNVLAASLTAGSGWVGAQFVSVSANLVVGPSSPYYTDPTATDSALNAIYVDTVDYNVQPGVNQPATTTAIPEAATLKGKIVPAAVITEGDEKIGIVGVTTQILETISSPSGTEIAGYPGGTGANGEVDDMDLLAAQLQPIIDEMIAEGVDKIILQSHLQIIGNEIELASKLKGVDIILSAGSNTRMGDADDEAVEFPGHAADFALEYPYLGTDAEGNPILIVNTDNEYTYLGRLVVDFDENGHIITDSLTANQSINGAIAATEENVAEAWGTTVGNLDATAFAEGTKGGDVKTITDAVQGVIDVKDGNVYGYSTVYLEGERGQVRNQETNLGNLSADANGGSLTTALKDALGTAAEGAYVVSIKNGGGIRAQIGTISAPDPVDGTVDKLPPEGGVSQLDVENSLRFDNKLIAFDTTPEGLKAILEHGVASYGNQGRFPQIGGVAFSFDPDAPAGSRILDLALVDEEGNTLVQLYDDGVLLEDVPAEISVVTLNFLADGGDGYPMKANGENFRYLLADGTLGPVLDETQLLVPLAPANTLGEQAAFERYMRENHGTEETAYDLADTDMAGDERIQNLNARAEDTVLASEQVTFSGDAEANMSEGGALDDMLSGNAGNDMLKGHGGNDLLRGGGDDDLMFGGSGDDALLGGSGDDEIYGGDQDDEVEGGRGDDMLIGGNGSDAYSYEEGDGTDTIAEDGGLEGDADRLVFQDIDSDKVSFTTSGNDVVILLEDGSAITLKDQVDGSGGVEEIVFADGETLARDAILGSVGNIAPVAQDDALGPVAEDAAPVLIAFSDLLANDTDVEDDVLTVTGVKNVVGGIAQLTAEGVLFTPAANFNGQASFEYTVSDGEDTAQAKASFTVTAVNDGPVAADDTGAATALDTKLFDLLANDADGDGGALSLAGFSVTSVAGLDLDPEAAADAFAITGNQLAFSPDGAFDGLARGETATVKVAYLLSDGQGGTDEGEFVLQVTGTGTFNPITGTDQTETLAGTRGDDLIRGLGGDDVLRGGAGFDRVEGGAGNDDLRGGLAADVLDGGADNDQMRGGAGRDTFVFRSGYGTDTVFDFKRGTDVVQLDSDDFTNFDALMDAGAITVSGAGANITTFITLEDDSQLVLRGINGASLTADDFRFV